MCGERAMIPCQYSICVDVLVSVRYCDRPGNRCRCVHQQKKKCQLLSASEDAGDSRLGLLLSFYSSQRARKAAESQERVVGEREIKSACLSWVHKGAHL